MCVFVFVPPLGGTEGPKTGPKAQFGGFGPHTDRDNAGRRPALIELLIFKYSSAFLCVLQELSLSLDGSSSSLHCVFV